MVFYRKYRPQTISDLDSAHIRETLTSVLSGTEAPHAFLFTGPKGLGKTSTARIVAKIVNCLAKRDRKVSKAGKVPKVSKGKSPSDTFGTSDTFDTSLIEPCNECEQCISITSGNNVDIIEIDGASHRGIDEIRDLKEKIRLSPVAAVKKVYIIDEVHMLTTEAFNALLKTLEEPPAHAMFILCTTEPQKVPDTIISRSFHVAFRRASVDELTRSFERIAKGEGLQIDSDALEYIARLSDGGFRDGAKILEEISLKSRSARFDSARRASSGQASGNKITKELLEETYHHVDIRTMMTRIIEFLSKKDAKGALREVENLAEKGTDMKYVFESFINDFHSKILIVMGAMEGSDIDKENVKNMNFSLSDYRELIVLFNKAAGDVKFAVLPQLPLELAIVEYCVGALNQAEPNAQLRASEESRGEEVQPPSISIASPATFVSKDKESDSSPLPAVAKVPTEGKELLYKLIDRVKQDNHSIAGVLRGSQIENVSAGNYTVTTGFKFHSDKLHEQKSMELLEKALQDITGEIAKVSVELREKPA